VPPTDNISVTQCVLETHIIPPNTGHVTLVKPAEDYAVLVASDVDHVVPVDGCWLRSSCGDGLLVAWFPMVSVSADTHDSDHLQD